MSVENNYQVEGRSDRDTFGKQQHKYVCMYECNWIKRNMIYDIPGHNVIEILTVPKLI